MEPKGWKKTVKIKEGTNEEEKEMMGSEEVWEMAAVAGFVLWTKA